VVEKGDHHMPHLSGSRRISTILITVALVGALGFGLLPSRLALAADYSAWSDLGVIYTPPSGRAYYPSVLYDANGFGGGSRLYKMWYSDGSGGVFVITSMNGFSWGTPTTVSGLRAGAHHVQVLYDVNCFGASPCDASAAKYKTWYWASPAIYDITAMATAQSIDGITWTNDTLLTQSATDPLVTTSGWNRGTYGPISLIYQAGVSNTGTNPWDYRYVMYYDGTSGGTEDTGLAYSIDGLLWTAYAPTPVLAHGGGTVWDANYATYGTVTRLDGLWQFWYSGGVSGANEGIGYASSSDGLTWTKDSSNPIFHISDGVSYRGGRVYTPVVIDDGSGILKMYYSAVTTGGVYRIGLALNVLSLQTAFVDDNWVGLPSLTQVTFPGDPDPHFIGIDAFDAIQGGVNAIVAGGTVKVAPGTYAENVTVAKSLTLNGAGAGGDPVAHTIIDGAGLSGRGVFIQSNVTSVTLTNLRVQKFTGANGGGIYANSGNDNFTVKNTDVFTNGVSGVSTGGIYMHGPVNSVVVDNVKAYSNLSRGIVIWGGFKTNITFTNNDVRYNNCCGIELQDGTASGVVISGNTVISNTDSGMVAIGLMAGAGQNLIANNTLQNNGRFGIEIKLPNGTGLESGDGSIVVSNNLVELTAPMGTLKPSELRDLAGISVYRRGWVTATNNVDVPTGVVVKNNTVNGFVQNAASSVSTGFGVVIEGTAMEVYGNTVSNTDVGIQWQAGHLPYTPNTNVDGDQSNAADLYFGRGNSPTVCATVSGNIFSGNGVNQRGVPSTLGTSSVTNVDTGRGYCSIQSAINDPLTVAGNTISLAAGTYSENITVTKSITLAGAGQSSTIIYPALSNPDCRFGGSAFLCTGAPTTTASIIALVQANNVVIHDLTFDGDNPALTSGVVVAGADLDARGGIITNQAVGAFSGLQIYNTTVKNIYLRGIQIYDSATGFNVHDNRVENVKGDPNQSIAIFNRSGSGIFARNVVSGTSDAISSNWSSGTQYISNTITNSDSGVHSDNNGGSGGVADLIQGNQVSTCTPGGYGVWVFAPFVDTNVLSNTVSGCDIGLGVFGQNASTTVNFGGNHVTGRAGSKGVYVTTDQLGFGSNNVSATFTNNQIDNSADGFYLESQTGRTLNVVAVQNTLSRNVTAINLASAGTAAAVIKGNVLVTQTTVFSQTGGTLIAYANSIGNFTTGLIDGGGSTTNLKHNWWGTYADPVPTGLSAADWQARLGAPILTWADGVNGAALLTATLSGGTGMAVIVNHGRGLANAPFDNGITSHADNMCSDFYDFFTVNGSGNWNVSVPVDNTTACNSQTLDPGKIFWIPFTTTYSIECTATNPACWDLITNTVTTSVSTSGQNIAVSNLSVADLGGTPFVAGSDGGNDPTAVTLTAFGSVPTASKAAVASGIALLIASLLGATMLLIRYKCNR
jgi:hypothetical protein